MSAPRRDRDVRNAIKTLIEATGQFDTVSRKGLPAEYGSSAGDLKLAIIQPDTIAQSDRWDATDEIGLHVDSTVMITILARNEDPEVRDDLAENLMWVAINAIQGKSLAELTAPDLTRFVRAKFMKPKAPERQIVCTFVYSYIVDGWSGYEPDEE